MPLIRRLVLALLFAVGGLSPALLYAQQAAQTEPELTTELLQNRVQEVESSSEIVGADREALLDFYRKSISLIEQRQEYQAATKKFAAARESAPRETTRLRAQLKALESREAPKLPDSLSRKALPELEQQLLSEKADLAGLAARSAFSLSNC